MKGYDIKIRLDDFRPLTWRDLIIPENITFHQLHLILQDLWGFYDGHLYEFRIPRDFNTRFIDFDRMDYDGSYIPEFGEENSKESYISDVFDSNKKVYYYYDFGDSWSFTIEIKNKVDFDKTYPVIKRYKGEYNPVEDCGGVWGLSDMIEHPGDYEDELSIFDLEYTREYLKFSCDFKNSINKIVEESTTPANHKHEGFVLDIYFNDVEPFTSRTIVVPSGITFKQLHDIIQCLVGLENYHGYQFIDLENDIYFCDEEYMADDELNADDTVIDSYITEVEGLLYEYDFGETIYLSVIFKESVNYDKNYVSILNYTGDYNYVEDCHGTFGFIELLHLMNNPEDADEEELQLINRIKKFDQDKIQQDLIDKYSFEHVSTLVAENNVESGNQIEYDYDFIVRDDGVGYLYETPDDESKIDTLELVKNEYPYIFESMEKEDIKIENNLCDIFKEIVYDNMVVGFCCYEALNCIEDVSLNFIYVLPEFRGKRLFYKEISGMMMECNVGIFEPTAFIVELLIKYGWARELKNNLIASAINFDVPSTSYLCNKINEKPDDDTLYGSNLYDMNICATLYLEDISNKNIIFYSRMLNDDMKRYDCKSKRLKLNKKYFKKIKKIMNKNSDRYIQTINELRQNIPVNNDDATLKIPPGENAVELLLEFLGEEGKLSPLFYDLIDNDFLEYERALEIQSQLIDEVKKGMVTADGFITRVNFLSNKQRMESTLEIINLLNPHTEDICPFCKMDLEDSVDYCNLCGYNLHYVSPDGPTKIDRTEEAEIAKLLLQSISNGLTGIPRFKKNVYYLNGDFKKNTHETSLKITAYYTLNNLIHNPVFDDAINLSSSITRTDEEEIADYIIQEKLVTDELSRESWEKIGFDLTAKELKDILKKNKQKVSGKKADLISRIYDTISPNNITNYLYPDGNLKFISEKGLKFIEEYEYINKYRLYLDTLSLDEFNTYYHEHNMELTESMISFLEEHEQNAIKNHNQKQYINALETKREILKKEKYPIIEQAINEIKLFNINLNPLENVTFDHNGKINYINTDNINEIRKLNKKDKISIKYFEELYNLLDYNKTYSLKKSSDVLNMVLDNQNINKIRKSLE